MNDNDSRNKLAGNRRGPDSTTGEPEDPATRQGRREPVFTDFDEEEDYEEAERDTDYAAAYEDEPDNFGIAVSTLLTLVVLPALYRWFDDQPGEA